MLVINLLFILAIILLAAALVKAVKSEVALFRNVNHLALIMLATMLGSKACLESGWLGASITLTMVAILYSVMTLRAMSKSTQG